ncbi:MAG TPA: hypothetical protein VMR81_05710 [Patescibacteria group bacterium]|nr:hypothetical protein [Patescibacteria group bacterium]
MELTYDAISFPAQFMKKTRLSPIAFLSGALYNNVVLWRSTFWHVWEPLRFDEKLTWIVFIGQTVAVITLLEFILFKR